VDPQRTVEVTHRAVMPDHHWPRRAKNARNAVASAAIATILAASGSPAAAQSVVSTPGGFENLQHSRSVSISGTVSITSGETGETETASQSDFETEGGSGPAVYDSAAGLSAFGLSTSDGAAGGGGRASAKGEAGAAGITYDGFADVFVGGYSNFGYASGSGGASSSFTASWTVAQRTVVEFTIQNGADPVLGDFSVQWAKTGGPTIFEFSSTGDGLPDGAASWTTRFVLDPGAYTLQSNLTAYAQFEADLGFAGRSLGNYRIAVIPEPASTAMVAATLLAGLVGVRRVLGRRGQPPWR